MFNLDFATQRGKKKSGSTDINIAFMLCIQIFVILAIFFKLLRNLIYALVVAGIANVYN